MTNMPYIRFHLPKELKDRLKQESEKKHISMSKLIVIALQQYLSCKS